jgi:hypothetical protein
MYAKNKLQTEISFIKKDKTKMQVFLNPDEVDLLTQQYGVNNGKFHHIKCAKHYLRMMEKF